MATNVYECMFIFDANAYARDPGGVSGRVSKMVEDCGGQVLASRFWNEQKLAYQIEGHRKGTYWLAYFSMDSLRVDDFKRACKLNDSVVRSLVLKVDPRLVEMLGAHAKGEAIPANDEDEGDAPTEETTDEKVGETVAAEG